VSMPTEPVVLDVDPVRISQVLINLIDNASKYTDKGGQIWLSAEPSPDGRRNKTGRSVAIRVRDNGVGMSRKSCPRCFDMFTQGARTRELGRGGWASAWRWCGAWWKCTKDRSRRRVRGGAGLRVHRAASGDRGRVAQRTPEREPSKNRGCRSGSWWWTTARTTPRAWRCCSG
jgi:hypothetical protein